MARFAFVVVVLALAVLGCERAERQPAGEMTSDSMHMMMGDSGMMADSAHMMAGDTAKRM